MATTTWAFGSLGSGFYATVTFDGVNFKISCIEGAFDLNALWFSDGDGDGDVTPFLGPGLMRVVGCGHAAAPC